MIVSGSMWPVQKVSDQIFFILNKVLGAGSGVHVTLDPLALA